MAMPTSRMNAAGVDSPLRVIALFILLSEAAASVAAVGTDGATRFMLGTFAVTFPLLVFAVFVWLLLRHPANLYAPSQYTTETNIDSFIRALTRERQVTQVIFERAVSEAVVTGLAEGAVGEGVVHNQKVARHVADAFSQSVQESSVTVVRSLMNEGLEPARIPVGDGTTAQELVDSVYFSLVTEVGPYTYGKEWVLARDHGDVLAELGSAWAGPAGVSEDRRPLSEIGVEAGMTLTVLPRGHPSFKRRN